MLACRTGVIGPLHNPVTWYKVTHTGEQVAQWDFQNNAAAFDLEIPLHNLLTSVCDFVPCDRAAQKAYFVCISGEQRRKRGKHEVRVACDGRSIKNFSRLMPRARTCVSLTPLIHLFCRLYIFSPVYTHLRKSKKNKK